MTNTVCKICDFKCAFCALFRVEIREISRRNQEEIGWNGGGGITDVALCVRESKSSVLEQS